MLREALALMKKFGAKFVFSGEVLGQRPMSQTSAPLKTIERDSGLGKKLLRPLSAKLLPISEAEDRGWVKRSELLDISGRGRKTQMIFAEKYGLSAYSSPAGGCLLAEDGYSKKLKDLLFFEKKIREEDLRLLRFGRHFRFGRSKIIIGKNEQDNKAIKKLKDASAYVFEAKNCVGPTVILQGPKTEEAIKVAASMVLRYSKSSENQIVVLYGRKAKKEIVAQKLDEEVFENFKIT
jgi:tRNA U34 2-thiouridine synthase MnmA/TrmU